MKINFTTLGCPKNIVDSEYLLGGLQGADVEFVDDPGQAETIILNTCGFIQGAKEESIDAILQALELKKEGKCRKVFVTGCLSQRYSQELAEEMPEVDGFYGNRDMGQILSELTNELDLRREILGERLLTTPSHFAYLKVSEGCENPCTFCAIPAIRGGFKSRPVEQLVDEAQMLVDKGVRELIIVGQDTTIYGRDLYGERRLVSLLDQLCDIKALRWLRLLYTYPAHFTDDLIEIITDKREVINYVDMPVQHASDRILQKMGRKAKRRDIERIFTKLREGNPEIALRSTLLVGFPGETDADHRELYDFVDQMRLNRLGLFTFSSEEGTPAHNFTDHVPYHIMNERWAELNDLQNQISFEHNELYLGRTIEAVIDEYQESSGCYIGRSSHDCPEIDNSVIVRGSGLQPGAFCPVEIDDVTDYELHGAHIR